VRVFTRQHAGDRQARRQHRRHVLTAVHGEIDLTSKQGVFDFLHEQTLSADL